MLDILFYAAWVVHTLAMAVRGTIESAPQLITNFLFIQLVVLYPARRIWKHKDEILHKKKTGNNVAAGVSSMSSSHIAGLHTLF